MLSTPPAIKISPSPARIALTAMLTAAGDGEVLGAAAVRAADELAVGDDPFPDILPALEQALADEPRVTADPV